MEAQQILQPMRHLARALAKFWALRSVSPLWERSKSRKLRICKLDAKYEAPNGRGTMNPGEPPWGGPPFPALVHQLSGLHPKLWSHIFNACVSSGRMGRTSLLHYRCHYWYITLLAFGHSIILLTCKWIIQSLRQSSSVYFKPEDNLLRGPTLQPTSWTWQPVRLPWKQTSLAWIQSLPVCTRHGQLAHAGSVQPLWEGNHI